MEACDLSPEAQQQDPLSNQDRELFVHVCAGRLARARLQLDTHPQKIHLQNQSGVGLLDAAAHQASYAYARSGCRFRFTMQSYH